MPKGQFLACARPSERDMLSDALDTMWATAKAEAYREERSEVNEAIKKLARIVDMNHITQDHVVTASALLLAKQEEDKKKYIKHLEQKLEALTKEQ